MSVFLFLFSTKTLEIIHSVCEVQKHICLYGIELVTACHIAI